MRDERRLAGTGLNSHRRRLSPGLSNIEHRTSDIGSHQGWFELQATTPVPEWGGQAVRMAQEEDAVIGADGKIRWALKRQDKLFLVR